MFGPVFCLFKFNNEDEAICIANDTNYGLGASIFIKDEEKGALIAQKIDSGMVFVNSSSFSDSRLPYGGTKESGYGRTSADEAFREFTNNKVISIRK
jgi:succinate-semialdehyde dehydrogenase/glutarate-semialdehyde dehydrogenase